MSTPAWYFHRDSKQYCTYLHSFLEGDALLCTITSKPLTLSNFLSLFFVASMGGALVRALASHQYGWGSDPGLWVEFVANFLPYSEMIFLWLLWCSP